MARQINWTGFLFLTLSPVAALTLSWIHLSQQGFVWSIWITAILFAGLSQLSITAGYHRYFSHRAYSARPWLQWFWACFGAATFQNSIWIWARDHRIHHRFVDTEKDPYSIKRGFWWAHIGWMLVKEEPTVSLEPYGRDLKKDPVVQIQDKYYVWFAVGFGLLLPTLIGALMGSWLGGLAVIGFARIVAVHHSTFLINSWCHMFGGQTYTTQNTARDAWWLAVLTQGEGYHNFHHLFAQDYRNGIRWYHWDPTKWTIRALSWLGATYDLKRTPEADILKARLEHEIAQLRQGLPAPSQMWVHLDKLKANAVAAHARLITLREEYRTLAKSCHDSSKQRLAELRYRRRLAKIEFSAAMKQWMACRDFLSSRLVSEGAFA
jgi:stearoyl-CoA desaturase (Delta-9 desaturase)